MRQRVIALVTATAALLAGCAVPAAPKRRVPSVPMPTPIGMQVPASLPSVSPVPCDPKQSLRPREPLPAAGQMPVGPTMARIRERGRLIVGTGATAYLLSYRDPFDGSIKGFEADIIREIAFAIFGDRDEKRIQFRALNAYERIPAVRGVDDQGKEVERVDMVIASMTMTCDRWRQVAFSAEYYSAGQRILVNRGSGITGMKDLGGKKVCASAGTTNIRGIAEAESKPVPVGAANTSDCLLLLEQGQIDAVSTGDLILAGLAAQDAATEIVGERFTNEPTGIAINQESTDLVRFVNAVLAKLVTDGTWARLQTYWLAEQIGAAQPPVPQYQPE